MIPLSNEFPKFSRLLRTNRMLAPKPRLWFPVIHEKSSVMFVVGVVRLKLLAKRFDENTLRNVIAFRFESPVLVNAWRVKPYLKLLILLSDKIQV